MSISQFSRGSCMMPGSVLVDRLSAPPPRRRAIRLARHAPPRAGIEGAPSEEKRIVWFSGSACPGG